MDRKRRHLTICQIAALIDRIRIILKDKEQYRRLTASKGSNAQRLLNMFQRLLDVLTDVPPDFRHKLIVAKQRLARKSRLYPASYELTDVTAPEMPRCSGGFADIFKGDFRGHAVCLKFVRLNKKTQIPHFEKVVSKEAILWGQLRHPNILPFYGIYRFNNGISLVAPWMENGDVCQYLKQHDKSNRIVLVYDVAQGLKFLHENKIIHGDLKGKNILVNDHGRACVADFGISSISDKDILNWTSCSSAASKGGSVRWQAPELFEPEGDNDIPNSEATDIYAWACVAYEIFVGQVPFADLTVSAAVVTCVLKGERPARPPASSLSWSMWGLTDDIWLLMEACWKEQPAERPMVQTVIDQLAPALPPHLSADANDDFLSPEKFREMVHGSLDSEDLSVETFENLLLG
ncbi:hypothetical protein C0995_007709 [Termitomyces sp. Mi166|nr:hypothetical protein C0995_007709 [Termitomyces sp. Mi166\